MLVAFTSSVNQLGCTHVQKPSTQGLYAHIWTSDMEIKRNVIKTAAWKQSNGDWWMCLKMQVSGWIQQNSLVRI